MLNAAKSVYSAIAHLVRPRPATFSLNLRVEPELEYLNQASREALVGQTDPLTVGSVVRVHDPVHIEESYIAERVNGRVGGEGRPSWSDGSGGAPRNGVCLSRVENIVHTPEYGAVITADGGVLKSSIGEALYLTPDLAALPGVTLISGEAVMTVPLGARQLARASVFVAWGGRFNYGHFLLDCLSALCVIADEGLLSAYRPVAPPLVAWHRELLELFLEPDEPRVLELADEVVTVGDSLIATPMDHFLHAPGPPLDSVRRRILSRLPGQHTGPERIYLSRRRDEKRRLHNEADLEFALEQRGFLIVDLHALCVSDQIALFRAARVIVGPTGAAFANCLFCEPRTDVFEIQPTNYTGIWTRGLCLFVDANWNGYFAPSPLNHPEFSHHSGANVMFDWMVPLDDFLKFLDARLAS